MQLFYSDHITTETTAYTFTREESKHIIKVLRKQQGDCIYITNGNGYLFTSSILDENPNKCTVTIDSYEYHNPTSHYLHMAVAPTKANDRFEWFLEKATEMGVSEITPILCDHSERKAIKWERYNRIIQSALKQSLQYHLPKLNQLTTYKEFMEKTSDIDGVKLIAHCDEGNKTPLKDTLVSNTKTTILIGPEGDFSKNEIESARSQDFKEVTLGTTRLRTETAALWACCNVSILHS